MKLVNQPEMLKEVFIEGMHIVVPYQYNWIAIDSSGELIAFIHKPSDKQGDYAWNEMERDSYDHETIGFVDLEGRDWTTCIWEV